MAHELVPRSGQTLNAAEVAERLAREFAFVEIDEVAGRAAALRHAEWIEKANPAIFLGRHEEALSNAQRLRNLTSLEALVLRFGDTARHLTSITVLPNDRIKFGYSGDEEERAMRSVVERCAKALDAEVVAI